MASIDKTPIYLNIPAPTTVQTIVSMKIKIITQGQENWWITIILAVLVSEKS